MNMADTLVLAREKGLNFKIDKITFFLGHARVLPGKASVMGRLRAKVFVFLSRNEMDAAAYFHIPADRVFEVGVQIEL